ncbi:MAG: hypothetical protein AAGA77_00395 [Bacteroidota bacterium]
MRIILIKIVKSILLLIIVSTCSPIVGQDYFSRIIPFYEDKNPNGDELVLIDDHILISVIYHPNNSTLIKTDLNLGSFDYFDYNNFALAADPFLYSNGNIFLFGKDRSQSDDLRLLKLDDSYEIEDAKVFKSSHDYTFPLNSCVTDGNMYISSFHDNEEPDGSNIRGVNVKKLNDQGEEIWSGEFGAGLRSIYSWKLVPYIQNSILMSTAAHKDFKIVSQLHTVNFNLKNQHYEAEEGAQNGLKSHPVAVLSNDMIILNTTVSKSWDSEFIQNDWYPFPPKFSWINTQGENIKDTLLITDESQELYINDIEVGKGDYFYAYGRWYDYEEDLHYGWIIKMSNGGDQIWSKKYLHPSLSDPGILHHINDIVELENGDIIALGYIRENGKVDKIWSVKINEFGCFGEESCEDELITSTSEVINAYDSENRIEVFPNPAVDRVTFRSLDFVVSKIDVFNKLGIKVPCEVDLIQKQLHFNERYDGMYFVHFRNPEDRLVVVPIVLKN